MSFRPATVLVQINGAPASIPVFVSEGDAFAAALTAYVTILETAKEIGERRGE